MGYRVLRDRDAKYGPIKGLEGPSFYPSGAVLYYDPKEGKYWNPKTDFYLENDEVDLIKNQIFDILRA